MPTSTKSLLSTCHSPSRLISIKSNLLETTLLHLKSSRPPITLFLMLLESMSERSCSRKMGSRLKLHSNSITISTRILEMPFTSLCLKLSRKAMNSKSLLFMKPTKSPWPSTGLLQVKPLVRNFHISSPSVNRLPVAQLHQCKIPQLSKSPTMLLSPLIHHSS